MLAEEIEQALMALADLLTEQGVAGDIRLVGGAAMVLRYHVRVATDDVDAWYREQQVGQAARVIAARYGLPDDWLNSRATMYFPHEPEWELLWERGRVRVHVASARTLLAMKLRAGRPIRDGFDIEFLLKELSITDDADAVSVFDEFYPREVMSAKAKALLRAALEKIA